MAQVGVTRKHAERRGSLTRSHMVRCYFCSMYEMTSVQNTNGDTGQGSGSGGGYGREKGSLQVELLCMTVVTTQAHM